MGTGLERLTFTSERHAYDFHAYEYTPGSTPLTAEFAIDRVYEERGAIWAEISSQAIVGDKTIRLLFSRRTNLLSNQGWKDMVSALSDALPDYDWRAALMDAVERTVKIFRAGNKVERYEGAEHKITPHLLEPFVAGDGVTVLFGEGGMGKSTLAAAMAVSVACNYPVFGHWPTTSGPVLFFDYEDNSKILWYRIQAILRGIGWEGDDPEIYHKMLVSKVIQSQSDMRREIMDTGAVLCILDSIGMARGGDAMGPEDTIRLFRSLRSFDVPVLALDHRAKEHTRFKDKHPTPYGSVYTVNSARMLWSGHIAEASTATQRYINLGQTKSNHAQRDDDLGIQISYDNNADKQLRTISFTVRDKWWQDLDVPLWDKIVMLFDARPDKLLTTEEIAEATDRSRNQLSAVLKDHEEEIWKRKRGRAYEYTLYRHAARLGLVTEEL